MDERGWKQWDLAKNLDTREKNVRGWLKGVHQPSHVLYVRMCLLFGWPLPYSSEGPTPDKLTRPAWGIRQYPYDLVATGR